VVTPMSERASYRTIVADPPWAQPSGGPASGNGFAVAGGRPSSLPYDSLDVDTIAALPVRDLADKRAHLYLWVTNAYIEDSYEIARLWGFRPSVLLTWCKEPHGIGLGGTFVQTTEHVLFCRRGVCPANERVDTTWWRWARGEHSAKPEAFLDIVEAVSPGPRLEMFSRRARLGWDTWGNEALGHVEIAS
jgi:N6-adenosine-specific RNA methylase IME4